MGQREVGRLQFGLGPGQQRPDVDHDLIALGLEDLVLLAGEQSGDLLVGCAQNLIHDHRELFRRHDLGGDLRQDSSNPIRSRGFEQIERRSRARRQLPADGSERLIDELVDVDGLVDRDNDLVGEVRLHVRVSGDRGEGGHEPIGAGQLRSRPRRDDGHGGEDQADRQQEDGQNRPPALPMPPRRWQDDRVLRCGQPLP